MFDFNQPDLSALLSEKASATPPSETVQRVVSQLQHAKEVDSADLRKILGEIKGIEVGPNSVPAWMNVSNPSQ